MPSYLIVRGLMFYTQKRDTYDKNGNIVSEKFGKIRGEDSLRNIRVILDKSGNIMVEYNYDAWGNFVAEKVREACIVGAPFMLGA